MQSLLKLFHIFVCISSSNIFQFIFSFGNSKILFQLRQEEGIRNFLFLAILLQLARDVCLIIEVFGVSEEILKEKRKIWELKIAKKGQFWSEQFFEIQNFISRTKIFIQKPKFWFKNQTKYCKKFQVPK